MPIKPGSVRKYTMTVNGTSVIIGDREYPPTEIRLVWDQMDKSDLDILRQFTILSPIVFVDNNDNGYLGVLVIDDAQQVAGMTKNVWGVNASFLVIAPYQGNTRTINTLVPGTPSIQTITGGGYIGTGVTLYLWSTVFTPWGESTVSASGTYTTSSGNGVETWIWTPPVSNYYKKTRLYWNTTNIPTTATMLTEIQAGMTNSFKIYAPYVAYNTINPPTYSTAFSGYWAGGLWTSV